MKLKVDDGAIETIEGCEELVESLFHLIANRHGDDEAQGIFACWGGPASKRDDKLHDDALLLWQCDDMKPKLNVRQLAIQLGKERGMDPGALERKIWRVLRNQDVRDYLEFLKQYEPWKEFEP